MYIYSFINSSKINYHPCITPNDTCININDIEQKIERLLKKKKFKQAMNEMDMYYTKIKTYESYRCYIEQRNLWIFQMQLNHAMVQEYGHRIEYNYKSKYIFYYEYQFELTSIIIDAQNLFACSGKINKLLLKSKQKHCAWCLSFTILSKRKRKKCSQCKRIYYCCKNHQKKHWNLKHRLQCSIR